MIRHIRSNVIAYLALFIALGGTSYAATALPAHSVGVKQLKSNAVTTAKVKNHSLKVVDFARGQIPKGAKGATGPTWGAEPVDSAADPPPFAQAASRAAGTVTTPAKGSLYVYAQAGTTTLSCQNGTTAKWGLYVGHIAVPGSGIDVSTMPNSLNISGVLPKVAAGSHMISLGVRCDQGSLVGGNFGGGVSIGAILLGK